MIAGADTTTTDVNATVNITHTFSGDLLVVLTSPGGTTVALTTNNGGGSDDVYAGTTWDDNAELLTTNPDNYADGVATPLLIPEGALSPFNNEDPNGTWTLTIVDDAAGDSGTLVSWSLAIATSDMALTPTTSSTSSTTVLPINDDTVTDTVVIAAAGNSICDVKVTTSITHTYSGDLVIFLGSPAGTFVPLTRQRGGSNDDVYNGTVWDDSAADTASDFTYVDLVAATALVPEGALGALVGEDPNGTWTLGIIDLAAGDSGQLTGWTLDVDTCTCP
jgi:subtilisin-like proprotein convertase family protein